MLVEYRKTSLMHDSLFYDVVIIGAGMVGLTLARALADSRLRIAIVDQQLPATEWDADEYDSRVSAITLASQKIFAKLGVWPKMAERRISAFHQMQVWDAQDESSIHFAADAAGAQTLGYIIENRVVSAALYQTLQAYKNVEFIVPATLQEWEMMQDTVLLELSNGQRLRTHVVVGADGAHSQVRKLAKIALTQWDYAHTALVATVQTELPHQSIARQRFLPNGVLAFLPLDAPKTSSIVWSTTSQQATHLLKLSKEEFQQTLAEHFAYRLGQVIQVSDVNHFPLTMRHAKKYCVPHSVLVGDAAHTIHPLAGQGVNLGLLDAACLAEVMLAAHKQQRRIGSLATLRRYERWRKGDNLLMIGIVEGFKRLFTSDNSLVVKARGVGLQMADACGPLKNFFMKQGMGLKGDLPELAK